MFIHADLSWNFAKKRKKVGWDVLSNSILNKLHPGNAIFKQQLHKLQVDKENFQEEKKKKEKHSRKKNKNLTSQHSFSNKKIPDIKLFSNAQSDVGKEWIQLNEKFKTITQNFNSIDIPDKNRKRPTGGRKYEHVKPRYKIELKKIKHNSKAHKNLRNFTRKHKRMRPSSACSSPTKLGCSYGSIEETPISEWESNFSILKIKWDKEVRIKEIKDYTNLWASETQNDYWNTTIKSKNLKKNSVNRRRNLTKFYQKNNYFKKIECQTEKKVRKGRRRIKSLVDRKGKIDFDYGRLLQRKNQPYSYFKSVI